VLYSQDQEWDALVWTGRQFDWKTEYVQDLHQRRCKPN
jgi:hypothetical protein